MTSPFRILEILTCSLVTFLPYVMLVTYPFRHNLRCTSFLTTLAATLQLVSGLAVGLEIVKYPDLVTLIVTGIHILLALILIRAPFGKKLFAVLTTVNSVIALSLAAKYLERLLFPAQSLAYHWTYLVLLLILETMLLLPFALFMMRRHIQIGGGHIAPWAAIWLVPAAVLAAWVYMSLYGLLGLPVELLMIGLTAFSLLITIPFIRKPGETEETEEEPEFQTEAEMIPEPEPEAVPIPAVPAEEPAEPQPKERKRTLQDQKTKKIPILRPSKEPAFDIRMQAQQYDHLQARITQSNQFHRELRRHVDALVYRMEHKQYDKLQAHLNALQQQLTGEDEAVFCENTSINTILSYFFQMSGYCGVKVTTDVHLPAETAVAAKDLAVLVGDLLDNALDACKKQNSSDRRIFIAAWAEPRALYLTVENTYEGDIMMDTRGNYVSSKEPGCGMGLEVCRAIVSRYSGKLEITDSNGVFKVNVTLKY